MKTLKDFQNTVWYFNNGKIESNTYENFLCEFWNDETTTPRGVGNREFTQAVTVNDLNEVIERANYSEDLTMTEDNIVKFAIYTWGSGGRGPATLLEIFDTEEDAAVSILEGFEYDLQNKSSNRPNPYFSESEINEVNEEIVLERINEKIRNKY